MVYYILRLRAFMLIEGILNDRDMMHVPVQYMQTAYQVINEYLKTQSPSINELYAYYKRHNYCG